MKHLLWLALSVSANLSWGLSAFDGLVDVNGTSLYARVIPGQSNAPIIVMLNGLTQDTDHWNTVLPYLETQGATLVNIDLALQGRSMEQRLQNNFSMTRPVVPPLIVSGGLWSQQPTFPSMTITAQAKLISNLLKQLGIAQPVVLVGLSYGGGLAFQMALDYPGQISQAVLAAPYVFPLPSQDSLIQELVSLTLETNPAWSVYSDDTIYDLILRGLVYTTYYQIEPEVMKWSPPFESIAVAELVRGIRHMSYPSILRKGIKVPLHLIVAGNDQYIPRAPLLQFWSAVPKAIQGSSIIIQNSEHKMNEAVGPYLASWIWQLASNPSYISQPGNFLGTPETGTAVEQGGLNRTVQLVAAIPVETYINPENWPFADIQANPMAYLPTILTDGNPVPTAQVSAPTKVVNQ